MGLFDIGETGRPPDAAPGEAPSRLLLPGARTHLLSSATTPSVPPSVTASRDRALSTPLTSTVAPTQPARMTAMMTGCDRVPVRDRDASAAHDRVADRDTGRCQRPCRCAQDSVACLDGDPHLARGWLSDRDGVAAHTGHRCTVRNGCRPPVGKGERADQEAAGLVSPVANGC